MSPLGRPYDEAYLLRGVTGLSAQQRTAFAAVCAEWLYPSYAALTNGARADGITLRAALDTAWAFAAGDAVERERAKHQLSSLQALFPEEDEANVSLLTPLWEDAVASVAYALRASLFGDPRDALWAARQLYEASDFIVQLSGAAHTFIEPPDTEVPTSLVVVGLAHALEDARDLALPKQKEKAERWGRRFWEVVNGEAS